MEEICQVIAAFVIGCVGLFLFGLLVAAMPFPDYRDVDKWRDL